MRVIYRRVAAVFSVIALSLGFCSCGDGDEPKSGEETGTDGVLTLTFCCNDDIYNYIDVSVVCTAPDGTSVEYALDAQTATATVPDAVKESSTAFTKAMTKTFAVTQLPATYSYSMKFSVKEGSGVESLDKIDLYTYMYHSFTLGSATKTNSEKRYSVGAKTTALSSLLALYQTTFTGTFSIDASSGITKN